MLKTSRGWTSQLYAALSGYETVAKLLLAKRGRPGFPIDWQLPISEGRRYHGQQIQEISARRTPLSYAAESGWEAIVKLLLATDGTRWTLVEERCYYMRHGRGTKRW